MVLPLSLLRTSQGHPMLVELKNGETYNGHLVSCDNWMNICLRDVICASRDGDRFWKLPELVVRGNNIKYLRIPEEARDARPRLEATAASVATAAAEGVPIHTPFAHYQPPVLSAARPSARSSALRGSHAPRSAVCQVIDMVPDEDLSAKQGGKGKGKGKGKGEGKGEGKGKGGGGRGKGGDGGRGGGRASGRGGGRGYN